MGSELAVAMAECGLALEEEAVANLLAGDVWRQGSLELAVTMRGKGERSDGSLSPDANNCAGNGQERGC